MPVAVDGTDSLRHEEEPSAAVARLAAVPGLDLGTSGTTIAVRLVPFPMNQRSLVLLGALLALLPGCRRGGNSRADLRQPDPRPVSILVEVYDPITNLVWENVSVRVVESYQEYADLWFPSPYLDWYQTDASGRVLLDEYILAYAEVGFVEDATGRALLQADRFQDEATVTLEIDALGFTPVLVDVPVRWDQPDVFVEVPFN